MVKNGPVIRSKPGSLPVISMDGKSTGQTCCATPASVTRVLPECVIGTVETSAGSIPRITGRWTRSDHTGRIRCRLSSFRMRYKVEPGLYALGEPSPESDVLVTANYKMTFDILRRELAGMNVWLLVLDTKGINVWCAAGKGTFGTDEIVRRTGSTRLKEIVSTRRMILPQLGAPGVSAAEVKRRTGFDVIYGPVRAGDIGRYIADGYAASAEMRTVTFTLPERAVLVPMELFPAMKKTLWPVILILLFAGLYPQGILFMDCLRNGLPLVLLLYLAVLAGSVFVPLMLPFIPGRALALKGFLAGLAAAATGQYIFPWTGRDIFLTVACWTTLPAVSSHLAMLFTGSTPFTGMSGTAREVRLALPVQIGGAVAGCIALILWKLSAWGLF